MLNYYFMKKIKSCFLFVLAIFMQAQMMANDVYLNFPELSQYGYKVAVWSWPNGGNGSWSNWMTSVSGHEGWYQTSISNSHSNVIFVFLDENRSTPDWNLDNEYEFQSIDLPYSQQNAYFVVNSIDFDNQDRLYNISAQSSFDGGTTPPVIETTYSVNLSITGNGTGNITLYNGSTQVASSASISETLAENSNIRFVLSVNENSFFKKWSDGNTSLDRSMTLTQNVSLRAEVVKKHHVVLNTDGHGTVTGDGYYVDENVTITATPNAGYVFDHWSDNNTDNPRTLNVTSDITLTAYFSESNILEPCQPANGDGTQNNQYKITKACELLWYALNYKSGDYAILDADISLNNVAWTPIGSKNKPYNANIDGRNHYVSDFTVVADTAGLFGYAKDADIRNIKIRNASVTGTAYTGIICGYATKTDIIACDNWAVVNGQMMTGGICGYLDNAMISNCLNEGAVNATGDYAGGVAGKLYSAEIENCINRKSVSSQADYVGGIVGGIDGINSSITTCSSSKDATVRGKSYVGGLCGYVAPGSTMTESNNEGAVYATDKECGGLVGRFDGSTAKNLSNYGYVESSSSQVGGVMGSSKNNSKLESCVNTGTVVATQDRHVGGIIGDASQTSLIASINIGQIQGKDLTGGIVGYFYESSKMVCCANYGAISGASKVGGLTGESRAKMTKSFSTGYVKGTSKIGGISGYLHLPQQAENCLYDNQMCPVTNAFGEGSGDGEGVSTSELIGTVSVLSGEFEMEGWNYCSWTMDNNGYPRPSTIADKPVAAAGASAIVLVEGDNADNFAHSATLTKINNAKWTSKGGTRISGTTATPSVMGQDTLYVTKGSFEKIVPLNITGTEAIENVKSNEAAHKFLLNGQVFILRDDKIYTLTGQEVK